MSERADFPSQPYATRLFRAVGLVVLGAGLHLMLPSRTVLLLPEIAPQHFVYMTAHRQAPQIVIERRTVFAPLVSPPALRPAVDHAALASATGTAGADVLLPVAADASPTATEPVAVAAIGDAGAVPDAAADDADASPPLPALKPIALRLESPRAARPTAEAAFTPPAVAAASDLSTVGMAGEPLPPSSGPVRRPTEEELVRQLLEEYAGAFERLDVVAVMALLPNVDRKALKRAFDQLAAQRLTLQSCGITISGTTANARCRGSATYQPKIGTRSVQIASREWTFDLSKKDTAWRIVNTYVR